MKQKLLVVGQDLCPWMGAIMSASGFTWCYVLLEALIAYHFNKLGLKHIQSMLSLGYLVVILPILGSGLAITIDSWAYFWRKRTFGSGAIAGYNSFAQLYNTYQAISAIPDAFSSVTNMFKDDDDNKTALVLVLVVVALAGGVLTTSLIIRATARSHAEAVRAQQRNRDYATASSQIFTGKRGY